MRTQEYLSQALWLRGMIARQQEQIEMLRTSAESVRPINYDKLNVQTSPDPDALANYMIRLEEAEKTAVKLLVQYQDAYNVIRSQISEVEGGSGLYREVLTLRWLDGVPLPRIAVRLNYAPQYIRQVHSNALKIFRRMFLEDDTESD